MFNLVEIKESLPKQHRSKITPDFINDLNKLVTDPQFAEVYAEKLVTYTSVLQEGRFKLKDYFTAVKFTTHMMLGDTSLDAYKKTFPDKIKGMVERNVSAKDISAYASTYKNSKLVSLIYGQTLIADCIMYASVRHKAIRRQAELMMSANEQVAQRAADSLMNHLKPPETSNLTIDIATKDSGAIADLASALNNLSNAQSEKIIEGTFTTQDIAYSTILQEGDSND